MKRHFGLSALACRIESRDHTALTQMNIQLANVISELSGVSGNDSAAAPLRWIVPRLTFSSAAIRFRSTPRVEGGKALLVEGLTRASQALPLARAFRRPAFAALDSADDSGP
jgi:hypothetical protein